MLPHIWNVMSFARLNKQIKLLNTNHSNLLAYLICNHTMLKANIGRAYATSKNIIYWSCECYKWKTINLRCICDRLFSGYLHKWVCAYQIYYERFRLNLIVCLVIKYEFAYNDITFSFILLIIRERERQTQKQNKTNQKRTTR